MHSQRSRIESAGRRAIAGDGCHYAGARVHGGESHLEHLSTDPSRQQHENEACGVKVGEHSAHPQTDNRVSDDRNADHEVSEGQGCVHVHTSDRSILISHDSSRLREIVTQAPFACRIARPSGVMLALIFGVLKNSMRPFSTNAAARSLIFSIDAIARFNWQKTHRGRDNSIAGLICSYVVVEDAHVPGQHPIQLR